MAFKAAANKISRRFPGVAGHRLRGIALFMVLVSLALMSSVVTDLSYNEMVRYRLATYERDALKAEALALGGVEFARLLLTLQGKLQPMVAQFAQTGMPLKAYTIWELLPIESGFLTDLSSGDILKTLGIDVSEALKDREDKSKGSAKEESGFKAPAGGFGVFDGSFSVKIVDEESKISLRSWIDVHDQKKRVKTKNLIYMLFYPKRYDDLFVSGGIDSENVDRLSLVANLFDWIDQRGGVTDPNGADATWGQNKALVESRYAALNLKPRNNYFDSFEELRLVKGMTSEIMDTFSDALSIYGEGGKINLLSAKDPVLEALIRYCAIDSTNPTLQDNAAIKELLGKWKDYKAEGKGPVNPNGFINFLTNQGVTSEPGRCKEAIGVESSNFTIKSMATVGDVTKTLTVVARFVNQLEEIYYFRNN